MKEFTPQSKLIIPAIVATVTIVVFLLVRVYTLKNPTSTVSLPGDINLWTIFLTGLITGGLTCLAVQGGLLAATIAQREEEKINSKSVSTGNAFPILSFLTSKLIAYTAFGFLLGWFGSLFQLSLTAQIFMQLFVVIFMLGTAFNILNVHPIFRYFVIQPPKAFTRLVRKQSKSSNLFAPAILGAFTVFIPCGTTQAMMALAIGSGSPMLGAAILFAFVLGTSPLFFVLGYFATRLGEKLHKKFMRVAAFSLIILALFNLNNILALSGINLQIPDMSNDSSKNITAEPQEYVKIQILDTGYTPNAFTVKAGSLVTFDITNDGAYGCAAAFAIPKFNYQKIVRVGQTDTITLKMPAEPTEIPFMCSMGMYRGVIYVI